MTLILEPIIKDENADDADVEAPVEAPATRAECEVSILPVKTHEGLFIRVDPPTEPLDVTMDHVHHDIVLVIDVSSSMNHAAPPLPAEPGQTVENLGLSILDLTKHAAKTIIGTLDNRDRLSIITFSTYAEVLLPFVATSENDKANASQKIDTMLASGTTNLWGGIQKGVGQFPQNNRERSGKCQSRTRRGDSRHNHSQDTRSLDLLPLCILGLVKSGRQLNPITISRHMAIPKLAH